jgi:hypothetical protein
VNTVKTPWSAHHSHAANPCARRTICGMPTGRMTVQPPGSPVTCGWCRDALGWSRYPPTNGGRP